MTLAAQRINGTQGLGVTFVKGALLVAGAQLRSSHQQSPDYTRVAPSLGPLSRRTGTVASRLTLVHGAPSASGASTGGPGLHTDHNGHERNQNEDASAGT